MRNKVIQDHLWMLLKQLPYHFVIFFRHIEEHNLFQEQVFLSCFNSHSILFWIPLFVFKSLKQKYKQSLFLTNKCSKYFIWFVSFAKLQNISFVQYYFWEKKYFLFCHQFYPIRISEKKNEKCFNSSFLCHFGSNCLWSISNRKSVL